MTKRRKYTCPCCGYLTLSRSPGSYGICHVCFWEDDPVQLLNPWDEGGANRVSLVTAQKNYAAIDASEERFKADVKGIMRGDVRNPDWRPVKEADRRNVTTPAELAKLNPDGPWKWYYWNEE